MELCILCWCLFVIASSDVCQMEWTRLFIFHGQKSHDDLCLRTTTFRHLCFFWFILLFGLVFVINWVRLSQCWPKWLLKLFKWIKRVADDYYNVWQNVFTKVRSNLIFNQVYQGFVFCLPIAEQILLPLSDQTGFVESLFDCQTLLGNKTSWSLEHQLLRLTALCLLTSPCDAPHGPHQPLRFIQHTHTLTHLLASLRELVSHRDTSACMKMRASESEQRFLNALAERREAGQSWSWTAGWPPGYESSQRCARRQVEVTQVCSNEGEKKAAH